MFSEHNELKLKINNRNKTGNSQIYKNNLWIKEEIRKKSRKHFEVNVNNLNTPKLIGCG